jgi:hypothetical protein
MENFQNVDAWVWVVVVLGLVVIGVLAALAKGKKGDWDHSRAEAIRRDVEEQRPELLKREATTLESEAQAARARADAERLEAQASEQRHEVDDQRDALTERLRKADERDPEVDTNAGAHKDLDASRQPD